MILVGIDLGKDGAVVLLDEKGKIVKKYKTPVLKAATKGGKKQGKDEYDIQRIRAILAEAKELDAVAVVEKGQPMPMAGSIAQFHRGFSYGLYQGLLAGLGIPYEVVSPRVWQGTMLRGINIEDSKQASIIAAQRLWPKEDWRRSEQAKKPDDGYTDAALIGEYGRRMRNGGNI